MNDTDTPALRSATIDARVDEDETEATSSVLGAFAWGLARDVRIAMRSKADLGVQLLFYVPGVAAADSGAKIQLLGFTSGLVSVKEVKK